jgi:hypothetical protein
MKIKEFIGNLFGFSKRISEQEKEITVLRESVRSLREEIHNMKAVTKQEQERQGAEKKRIEIVEQRAREITALFKEIALVDTETRGVGRPKLNRVKFDLYIDPDLKPIIKALEAAAIFKRGEVTNRINAFLRDWLTPLFDQMQTVVKGHQELFPDSEV